MRSLPWRRPRRETLLLLLVALATLTPLYVVSSQDVSRLCLSRSLLDGRVTIAPCVGSAVDRAQFAGHVYSDKAPGVSLLALPVVAATALPSARRWRFGRNFKVWLVRLATGGLAFVLLVLAVGRVAEGLAEGTGGLVAVTFALGTLAAGLAATTFDQVPAAACGFGAFLCAWNRRPLVAGLLAGLALLVEYQAAIVVAAVGVYGLWHGARQLARYALGVLPGALALAAYDRAAFGSPFHASYRYVANGFARAQAQGLFGISLPRLHSVRLVLLGDRGLLVASPVLLAAAVGLVLLGRRRRAEALVCGAVGIAFLLLEFGYFLPYGGFSPGPRFLIPALPFVSLGLAAAYARARLPTFLLAAASVVASTALALTWSWESALGYRQTVWGELVRALVRAHSRLRESLAGNVLTYAGATPLEAAAVVGVCALLALTVAVSGSPRRSSP